MWMTLPGMIVGGSLEQIMGIGGVILTALLFLIGWLVWMRYEL